MKMTGVMCSRTGQFVLSIASDVNGRELVTTHSIPLSIINSRCDVAMEMRDAAIRDHLLHVQHAHAEQFGTTHADP